MSSNANSNETPSLIGGHAQYVKGAAESAIGNLTSSQAWQDSGAQDTKAGVDAMKTAGANRDASTQGFGKFEEVAGKVAGCEGMEREGGESAKK
ncbi:hypothetical protein AAFC00_005462 [Neodothiora populina]|uniref:Uncharacterized protein n=1 Tax=Neodothiora populina TaxID=2781224 RepID=A0ABR3PM08_9PEZI